MILIHQIDFFPFVFILIIDCMYDCMKTLRQVILENMKCSSTMYIKFVQLINGISLCL